MLNVDDNENGKTKLKGLIVQHTFLYISFLLMLNNYNIKLTSCTFYGGNARICAHTKSCCLTFCSVSCLRLH